VLCELIATNGLLDISDQKELQKKKECERERVLKEEERKGKNEIQ